MRLTTHRAALLPLLFIAEVLFVSGCSQQTIDSAATDAKHDAGVVAHAADQAADEARPKLTELGLGARVTTALEANQNLPKSIHVNSSTTGVYLRGTVHTAQQKDLAGHIAKETLSGHYTVENDLVVDGGGGK
jgi:osmotically-inducible protein OsmY